MPMPPAPRLPADRRQSALAQLRTRLDKTIQAHDDVGNVRDEFMTLAKQGDTVNEEDLINAASAIVAHGADPREVATMLSTAPQQGPQLAAWVGRQLQQMNQLYQKIGGMREQARDQLLKGAVSHFAQTTREAVAGQMNSVSPQIAPPMSPNPLGVPSQ